MGAQPLLLLLHAYVAAALVAPTPPHRTGPKAPRRTGPTTPAPVVDDSGPLDRFLFGVFLDRVRAELGGAAVHRSDDWDGLIAEVHVLNARGPTPRRAQAAGRRILRACFPPIVSPAAGWVVEPLFDAYRKLFAAPVWRVPSARLNAWLTGACSNWLMGASSVADVEAPDLGWGDGRRAALEVERCRFLEAGGCASACVNLCKVPTQTFFRDDMGVPLLMEPDYDDFSCRFSFGKSPPPLAADEALDVACFAQCPVAVDDRPRCHLVDDDASLGRAVAAAARDGAFT